MARDPQRVTECLRDPLRAAVLGKGAWPIFLHGEAGSGKTLAALCVGDWCGDCAYVDMPTLCHMVNDAAFGRLLDDDGSAIQVTAVWKNWANANLAIIDEIGSRGKVSDAHFETLKMTLDSRERLNKPLIAISNLDPEALANVYDDRIASRLSAGTVCRVDGDRRLEIHDAQAVDSPSPAAAKRRVG
ncbi:MAG: hypothetical protein HY287_00620 [Planctomycetes bacterium]|nr:hypothetical protein [Planctomycetota bacterium]